MNDKKIMFFDIDGTLIDSGEEKIADDVLADIQKARKNGHLMFINTGRTYSNLDDNILKAGFDGFICACGTYIILNDNVELYIHTSDEICELVKQKASEHKLDIVFESYHGIYYDPKSLKTTAAKKLVKDLESLELLFNYIPENNFNYDKFVTWTRDDSELDKFIDEISEYFDYIDRGNGFSEFVPKGHSKATGIQFVLDKYGLDISRAHAVGDSTNDLPMLRFVPHSIAMGNSDPVSLFDEVEYVTYSIDMGGISNALKHYHFI